MLFQPAVLRQTLSTQLLPGLKQPYLSPIVPSVILLHNQSASYHTLPQQHSTGLSLYNSFTHFYKGALSLYPSNRKVLSPLLSNAMCIIFHTESISHATIFYYFSCYFMYPSCLPILQHIYSTSTSRMFISSTTIYTFFIKSPKPIIFTNDSSYLTTLYNSLKHCLCLFFHHHSPLLQVTSLIFAHVFFPWLLTFLTSIAICFI